MQLSPTIQPISSKGQFVIPSNYRKYMDMPIKGKVLLTPLKGKKGFLVEPAQDPIQALSGILKNLPQTTLQLKQELKQEESSHDKTLE